jgi:hypothetical protein
MVATLASPGCIVMRLFANYRLSGTTFRFSSLKTKYTNR